MLVRLRLVQLDGGGGGGFFLYRMLLLSPGSFFVVKL